VRKRNGKVVLSLLAVVGLLGSMGLFAAPNTAPTPVELPVLDPQPVAVLSIASVDELKADVAFVGKLTGNPQLATGMEVILNLATGGRGLQGLDTARPLGVVAITDGDRIGAYVCLPVSDFQKLLETAKAIGAKVDEAGEGIYRIATRRKPLFVKEQSGWAVLSEQRPVLDVVPDDPGKVLAEVGREYDLAARLHAANVPEKHRRELIDKIKRDAQRDMQRRPGESEEQHALRRQVTEELLSTVVSLVEEVDEITLGVSLDRDAQQAAIELSITGAEGTELAKAAARLTKTTSGFAGFLLPDAMLAGHWSGQMPSQKADLLVTVIEAVRKQAMRDIERQDKSAEEIRVARELAGDVFELVADTARSGRVDGGMAVVLKSQAATLAAGTYIADGASLDRITKQIARIAEAENPKVKELVKLDADRFEGVRFHTVSIPVPPDAEDREKVVSLVGESLEVVIGIGEDSAYVAAGRDALGTLKRAIAASAKGASQKVPPIRLSLAVDLLAEFIAEYGDAKDRPGAAKLAELLGESPGKDGVNLVAHPIPRGVKYRLEAESDILTALGKLAAKRK